MTYDADGAGCDSYYAVKQWSTLAGCGDGMKKFKAAYICRMRSICVLLVLGSSLLAGCAHSPTYNPYDPYEDLNRDFYAFNITLDKYILRPTAKAYVRYTPALVRQGVGNFITNLFYPRTIVNSFTWPAECGCGFVP